MRVAPPRNEIEAQKEMLYTITMNAARNRAVMELHAILNACGILTPAQSLCRVNACLRRNPEVAVEAGQAKLIIKGLACREDFI